MNPETPQIEHVQVALGLEVPAAAALVPSSPCRTPISFGDGLDSSTSGRLRCRRYSINCRQLILRLIDSHLCSLSLDELYETALLPQGDFAEANVSCQVGKIQNHCAIFKAVAVRPPSQKRAGTE
jgi:hypothetical protein